MYENMSIEQLAQEVELFKGLSPSKQLEIKEAIRDQCGLELINRK